MSRKNKNQDMDQMLSQFKSKEVNPTAALIEPMKKNEDSRDITDAKDLSDIVRKRKKVEETHTRRTFLIKNELLERLDEFAYRVNNTGFKTEFIHYIMEKGLNELENIESK